MFVQDRPLQPFDQSVGPCMERLGSGISPAQAGEYPAEEAVGRPQALPQCAGSPDQDKAMPSTLQCERSHSKSGYF